MKSYQNCTFDTHILPLPSFPLPPPSLPSQAHVLYSEAVSLGLFPSLYQRSLFNEPDLRDRPWWALEETGYQEQVQPVLDSVSNITE